jgi:hypothetical protein
MITGRRHVEPKRRFDRSSPTSGCSERTCHFDQRILEGQFVTTPDYIIKKQIKIVMSEYNIVIFAGK